MIFGSFALARVEMFSQSNALSILCALGCLLMLICAVEPMVLCMMSLMLGILTASGSSFTLTLGEFQIIANPVYLAIFAVCVLAVSKITCVLCARMLKETDADATEE